MEEIDEIIAASEENPEIPDEEENEYSWTVEDGAAVKQTDRHTFLYRETIVPPKIREYFGAADLEPGKKKKISLWHGDRRFDAFIEKTMHRAPRVRMIWKPDFASVLQKEYPQWLEFFRTSRAETGDTPWIRFTKRAEPDHYTLALEGVTPQEAVSGFEVPLSAGDTIDNDTLHAVFRCSLLGPMRRSAATGSLVLISDHTKPGCEDKWIGKVFHFTGMGAVGEQGPETRQNRTLAGSKENGVRLFLFEVFYEGSYVYLGEVELMDSPYRSRQVDSDKNMRDVPVFPLQLRSHRSPPLIKHEAAEQEGEPAKRKVRVISLDEAAQPAGGAGGEPAGTDRTVSELAKRQADGLCQLCGLPAPFTGRDGKPYLETHHIVPPGEGGTDTMENVVALCPNCHRKMHVLALEADVARLKKKAAAGQ